MIKMGDKVKDVISGFEGVATGRAEYLHGCVKILVEPEGLQESGKPIGAEWFDEQRLDASSETEAGGPQNDAPKN